MASIPRPGSDQFAPTHAKYIDLVPEVDLLAHLEVQARHFAALLGEIDEVRGLFRYAPGKWSVKELIGHISDTERIMAYRLLRIARGDQTPLAGFEMDDYVKIARADRRSMESLASEFSDVRQATLALVRTLDAEDMARTGSASGKLVSAGALAYIIPGHLSHHGKILEERYLL